MKAKLNEFGLTELQTKFLQNLIKDDEFVTYGVKAEVWTDYYTTILEDDNIMNKMQSGACITTLKHKLIINMGKMKRGKENAKYIKLTNKGIEIITRLIDLNLVKSNEKLETINDSKQIKKIEEQIEQRPIQVNDLVKSSEFDGRVKFRVQKILNNGKVCIANHKKGVYEVDPSTLRLIPHPIFNI